MKQYRRSPLAAATVLVALTLGLAACGSSDSDGASGATTTTTAVGASTTTAPADAAGPLEGTFAITAGDCAAADVTGSYFRMVQSGGTPADGPFVPNADSACTDQTFTALLPGTDGGLTTGTYQAQPDDPFDSANNGLADKIAEPVKFYAVGFAVSTNPVDPESGTDVPEPTISVDADGKLSGSVSAVSVAWNGQQFNQGAPKPDGSSPGSTAALTGTYDAETGAYELEWSSQIVGGGFDGFTGVWHLEGTFTAS